MSSPPVHLEALQTSGGYTIAKVTLDDPETLNALTQSLLDTLTARLQQWRDDPQVVCVVIQGAGERAFCAGGDIVSLYRWMRETPGQPNREAEHFLASEYRLHYAVHTFGKPVLGWGTAWRWGADWAFWPVPVTEWSPRRRDAPCLKWESVYFRTLGPLGFCRACHISSGCISA